MDHDHGFHNNVSRRRLKLSLMGSEATPLMLTILEGEKLQDDDDEQQQNAASHLMTMMLHLHEFIADGSSLHHLHQKGEVLRFSRLAQRY